MKLHSLDFLKSVRIFLYFSMEINLKVYFCETGVLRKTFKFHQNSEKTDLNICIIYF